MFQRTNKLSGTNCTTHQQKINGVKLGKFVQPYNLIYEKKFL